MKLVVDWDRCIGAGMCTSMAPAAFELDDAGDLVVLIDEERVPREQVDAVQDAVSCCPVEALQLVSE